jgi:hypothetical protein
MESLKGIVSDIRIFLYGGLLNLPLTIAGTFLILGLFTANYAMLFFLLGFLVLTPLLSFLINMAGSPIFSGWVNNPFSVKTGDICKIVVPYETPKNMNSTPIGSSETVITSTWMAMISFFIGYILTNALVLYGRESPEVTVKVESSSASDLNTKINNRKTQALVATASIIIFALIVFVARYYTGCESILGMIISAFVFGFSGNGWYKALSSVGQDRLSDLFGIANRLLTPGAIENGPIACVPIRT